LAKGALFLAVGVALALGPARWGLVVGAVLLLVLSFGGLPFTGGALAKAATKGQLDEGLVGLLAALSAAGTTMPMLHFTARLRATVTAENAAAAVLPWPLMLPWVGMSVAAVALPWALFPGAFPDAFSVSALFGATWPVLLGAMLEHDRSFWIDLVL